MLKPLGDRVIVIGEQQDNTTSSGIMIAAPEEKPMIGKVISVGQGRVTEQGVVVPLEVKEGDRVVFPKYAGNMIKLEEEEYLVLRESDIMVVVEKA